MLLTVRRGRQRVCERGRRSNVDGGRVDEHDKLLQFAVDVEALCPVQSRHVSTQFQLRRVLFTMSRR